MAWDTGLEARIEDDTRDWSGRSRKRMFGGLAWMANGNLAFAIFRDSLVVRVGPADYEACLREPGAGPFDVTGRPMRGWVRVEPAGFEDDAALSAWLERGWRFASALMPKT